jgi:hypothetical protein
LPSGIVGESKTDALWDVKPSLKSVAYLRRMNAKGYHVLMRPLKQEYYILCDDLNFDDLKHFHHDNMRYSRGTHQETFKPGRLVVETSPSNYQVWIHTSRPLSLEEKKYWLSRLKSDPGCDPNNRWGRAPGFTNRKKKYCNNGSYPLSKLFWGDYKQCVDVPLIPLNDKKKETQKERISNINYSLNSSGFDGRLVRYRDPNPSIDDFKHARYLILCGKSDVEIASAILSDRTDWSHHKSDVARQKYIERTIANARKSITCYRTKLY